MGPQFLSPQLNHCHGHDKDEPRSQDRHVVERHEGQPQRRVFVLRKSVHALYLGVDVVEGEQAEQSRDGGMHFRQHAGRV